MKTPSQGVFFLCFCLLSSGFWLLSSAFSYNPRMATSWDTFERYRQKGLDARRAGQWESARIYLPEDARAMIELSKEAAGEELREARREMSAKLLALARDCESAKAENGRQASAGRPGGGRRESSGEAEGGTTADQWMVKEKPT